MTVRTGLLASVVADRIRWTGAIVAVAALSAMLAIGPPGRADAATNSYDQITGIGQTDSAITVPWAQGLLDNTNKPITSSAGELASNSARAAGTGQLKFMYGDFKNLQVSVSQTEDITHQGVTVTWTGGVPTSNLGGGLDNFLQLMECYGDSGAGPDPTQCEYGSPGLLSTSVTQNEHFLGSRTGDLCPPGSVPVAGNPTASLNGDSASAGCDPNEPGTSTPSHTEPCTGTGCTGPAQNFSVPFAPADGSAPVYGQNGTEQYFSQFNSNEVQEAVTNPDGTGQQQFETLTSTEAPGLGCGAPEDTGQPRGCWLVIVPRGTYEPNGFQIASTVNFGSDGTISTSPLSAGNWAMRIQIHLGFAPVQSFCPIGTQERETAGTQIVSRAVVSWQLALNKAANCSRIFAYSAVPESTSTGELCNSGIGLAFTTIPIGSEASRLGTPAACKPNVLYAPVAVSALGFGFDINALHGYVTTPVNLTPKLMARALTQVYRFDLPDFDPNANVAGPAWSVSNPPNITYDPLFQQINPAGITKFGSTVAPLITEDRSAINQQVWQWIQADPAAAAWLGGTPDPSGGVTADPDFTKLNLGKAPAIDSFPRAYIPCLNLGLSSGSPPKPEIKCSLDLLPYTSSYESAAAAILVGNEPWGTTWCECAIAPDGSNGWWGVNGIEPLGSIYLWGLSDTPDLAAFGVIPASLCNDAGGNCVAPSIASLAAALSAAKPDSAGLLQVDPAKVGTSGYPLVEVTYAAVPTNQDAAALTAYADLISYAAGAGQTPGVAPGDLPPGYFPMPASLKTQALAVADELRKDAGAQASATPSASSSAASGVTPQPGGSLSPGVSGPSSSPMPYNVTPPRAELTAGRTQPQPVGAIRWALLAVVIAGAACATGGTVLRTARVPRWLNRARR